MPTFPNNVATTLSHHFMDSLQHSQVVTRPYRHWLLSGVFPPGICDAIAALPFVPAAISDTYGKRETHNASRTYFTPENQVRFPVCAEVAQALQNPATVASIEQACGVNLYGTSLRIEYCQDTDGFWLEPHTDIGAKKFTMLVYLSDVPGSGNWGTDIYDGELRLVATAPYQCNCGLIFIPATDTWHGFRRRPIHGVRKSLIVNYVGSEWLSRHELAYPDHPLGS